MLPLPLVDFVSRLELSVKRGISRMSSIVSDVGGTNARFAVAAGAGTNLSNIWTAKCADFPTIETAVEAYRETLGAVKSTYLDAMVIAVAGPVNAETVDVTNNHWLFNKHDLLTSSP